MVKIFYMTSIRGCMNTFFLLILLTDYINSFRSFIIPFIINISYKTNGLIKSLSGIIEKIPYIKIQNTNPVSIIDTTCDLEKCELIIPGYMEHDPKIPLSK